MFLTVKLYKDGRIKIPDKLRKRFCDRDLEININKNTSFVARFCKNDCRIKIPKNVFEKFGIYNGSIHNLEITPIRRF